MPSVEAILATTENQVAILTKQRRAVAQKEREREIYQYKSEESNSKQCI
jgi:hypothetical protein